MDARCNLQGVSELKSSLSLREMTSAWQRRDSTFDGLFVFGVKTTGIFCKPSCPSRPRAEHVEFFGSIGEAERAGYRACKRCRPEAANGKPPTWVASLMDQVKSVADERVSAKQLRQLGVTPERARRWFQQNYGMSFAAWQRGVRLSRAFNDLREGAELDDVIFKLGFESHSGFRSAFGKAFGGAPCAAVKNADCLRASLIETPMGPMLAAANDRAVVLLEFADRRGLAGSYARMKRLWDAPVVPGDNKVLVQLRAELAEYFGGERMKFSAPVELRGTQFQEQVWRELMRIPSGETRSYSDVAKAVGREGAVRAVARANATNRLYLIVPCHRVIGADGRLSGYGGGLARKKRLLELEMRLKAASAP